MRLKVTLQLQKPVALPSDHQFMLAKAVARFLSHAEADYSRWAAGQEGDFRLFAFSPVRSRRRRIEGDQLWLGAGAAEWMLSSPVRMFVEDLAAALRASRALEVGRHVLSVARVEVVPEAELGREARLTCLSPMVVADAAEGGVTRWLAPGDPAFGEAVHADLLRKHAALYAGSEAPPEEFTLRFDPGYLAEHRGSRQVTHGGARIRAAFAPFTVTGPPELIRVGYQCGFGVLNAEGYGMVVEDRLGP